MSIPAISVGDVRSYNTSFGNRANKKNSNLNNNHATSSVPSSLRAIPLATLIALSPINSNVYASEKAMMASEDAMIEMVETNQPETRKKLQSELTWDDVCRYDNAKRVKGQRLFDFSKDYQSLIAYLKSTEGMPNKKDYDPDYVLELEWSNNKEDATHSVKSKIKLYPLELIETDDGTYHVAGWGGDFLYDKRENSPQLKKRGGLLCVEIAKEVFEYLKGCADSEDDIPVKHVKTIDSIIGKERTGL